MGKYVLMYLYIYDQKRVCVCVCVCVYSDTCADRGSGLEGVSQSLLLDQDPFISRLRDRLEALDQMNAQLLNEPDSHSALSLMSAHSALQTPAQAQGQAYAPARGERTIMASSIDTHNDTSWAFTPMTTTDLRNNIDPSPHLRQSGTLSAESEKSHL
jgi:hypothetical protein